MVGLDGRVSATLSSHRRGVDSWEGVNGGAAMLGLEEPETESNGAWLRQRNRGCDGNTTSYN